jgi:hypothetical protein
MKSIVELINELKQINDLKLAECFDLSLDIAYYRRLDFDNWLRRCIDPVKQFTSIDEAWVQNEASFG